MIAPVAADHAYLEPWKDRLPIVFVDRRPVRLAADSFTEDDHGGALMATRHLVEHGHRRIAFVSDTPDLPTSHSRLLGYRAALAEAGIGENVDYEVYGAVDRGSAAGALRKLVELAEPPTAIMSSMRAGLSQSTVMRRTTKAKPWSPCRMAWSTPSERMNSVRPRSRKRR